MRITGFAASFALAMLVYMVFSGSIGPYVNLYDIVTGIIVSAAAAALLSDTLVSDERKLRDPRRLLYLIVYAVYYLFVIEIRAHLGVMKLILRPGDARPGIVCVPYATRSDYATVMVANSITNTPGTVVVDLDEEEKCFYVHWIRVVSEEPGEARRLVSSVFERYAGRILD